MHRKIRVLIAKPGLDGHDRGALVIAQGLRDAGMEVIYTGLRQTPKQIVRAALQEDVDAVGLSCLSGAHNVLFPEVLRLLREEKAEDIIVFGGGVIPGPDAVSLEEKGIRKIFTPGTPVKTVAAFVEQAVLESRGETEENALEPPQGVDHIGIAVRSIDEAMTFYADHLQLKAEAAVEVPEQGVKVAFIPLGNTKIELLEPLGEDSPVAKFIEKRGEGLHHVAFSTGGLEARLAQLKREGVTLLNESPVTGAGGYPIAFLHPKAANGTLVELCDPSAKGEGVKS
ncbi:methylmalonyl-CoA epimerase [Alteribacter natronophilus]|uniref:methylmalonyl-CoA epimerase n=1 Tax=Alteribacter natronophilus TaxID=2583810 RepID=UPI00110D7989|nr:methylmalonyl-CoA epimerase [Alteribacter natronophilus]TMW73721.1 methylmalonyl-CoA epimerase [Alteribacter natronophilus]